MVLCISMAYLPFVYFFYSLRNKLCILFGFSQPAGHKSGKVRKSGKSRSRSRGSSRSPSRKGGKKGGKKSRSPSPSKTKKDVDLLSPDAMVNGYYIAHNAPQFLGYRGFGWDTEAKGKKKKKGKGKKKKWRFQDREQIVNSSMSQRTNTRDASMMSCTCLAWCQTEEFFLSWTRFKIETKALKAIRTLLGRKCSTMQLEHESFWRFLICRLPEILHLHKVAQDVFLNLKKKTQTN